MKSSKESSSQKEEFSDCEEDGYNDSSSFDYDSDSDFKDEEEGLRYTLHVEIPDENVVRPLHKYKRGNVKVLTVRKMSMERQGKASIGF